MDNSNQINSLNELYKRNDYTVSPDSMFKRGIHLANTYKSDIKPFYLLDNSMVTEEQRLQTFLEWLTLIWNFYLKCFSKKPNRIILPIKTYSTFINCLNSDNKSILYNHIHRVFDSILIEEYLDLVSVGIIFHDESNRIKDKDWKKSLLKKVDGYIWEELNKNNYHGTIPEIKSRSDYHQSTVDSFDLYDLLEEDNQDTISTFNLIKGILTDSKNDKKKMNQDYTMILLGGIYSYYH